MQGWLPPAATPERQTMIWVFSAMTVNSKQMFLLIAARPKAAGGSIDSIMVILCADQPLEAARNQQVDLV